MLMFIKARQMCFSAIRPSTGAELSAFDWIGFIEHTVHVNIAHMVIYKLI